MNYLTYSAPATFLHDASLKSVHVIIIIIIILMPLVLSSQGTKKLLLLLILMFITKNLMNLPLFLNWLNNTTGNHAALPDDAETQRNGAKERVPVEAGYMSLVSNRLLFL
jgi:hypothetical protein